MKVEETNRHTKVKYNQQLVLSGINTLSREATVYIVLPYLLKMSPVTKSLLPFGTYCVKMSIYLWPNVPKHLFSFESTVPKDPLLFGLLCSWRRWGLGPGGTLNFVCYIGWAPASTVYHHHHHPSTPSLAAILIMWPRPSIQTFFPLLPGGCICNSVEIGPVVS